MIQNDQPFCFPDGVIAAVSSKDDKTMLDRGGMIHAPDVVASRETFVAFLGTSYADTAYQRIVYSDDGTYDCIAEVDGRSTTRHTSEVVADALFTECEGVGMFLPVADCVATILYDPTRRFLAVAHLGRQSTQANLVAKLIDYFVHRGSDPADLIAWMSPHASRASYRLEYFDQKDDSAWQPFVDITTDGVYIDMSGYNYALMTSRGMNPSRIVISERDTVQSEEYFSHSRGDTGGRFAVFAMMR